MAEPKCPCCNGHEFETKTVAMKGKKTDEARLIICSSCGAVMGVLSYADPIMDTISNYMNIQN